MAQIPPADARWLRVKALFAAALEQPPDLLEAWLGAQCGADVELRRDLDSLLASHRASPAFL